MMLFEIKPIPKSIIQSIQPVRGKFSLSSLLDCLTLASFDYLAICSLGFPVLAADFSAI